MLLQGFLPWGWFGFLHPLRPLQGTLTWHLYRATAIFKWLLIEENAHQILDNPSVNQNDKVLNWGDFCIYLWGGENIKKIKSKFCLLAIFSIFIWRAKVQFRSVVQSCPTLRHPMDCSSPGFPVHQQLLELVQLMSIELVMPSNHLILYCPLFLLPSIFPRIKGLFTSGGQSIGASASASVLPMNIQTDFL